MEQAIEHLRNAGNPGPAPSSRLRLPLASDCSSPGSSGRRSLELSSFGAPQLQVFSNAIRGSLPCKSRKPLPPCWPSIWSALSGLPTKWRPCIGAGARIFVEVGPRNVLTSLTRQILGDRPTSPSHQMRPAVPAFSSSITPWDSLQLTACPSSSTGSMRAGRCGSSTLLPSKRKPETSRYLPLPGWSMAAGPGRSVKPLVLAASMASSQREEATDNGKVQLRRDVTDNVDGILSACSHQAKWFLPLPTPEPSSDLSKLRPRRRSPLLQSEPMASLGSQLHSLGTMRLAMSCFSSSG